VPVCKVGTVPVSERMVKMNCSLAAKDNLPTQHWGFSDSGGLLSLLWVRAY